MSSSGADQEISGENDSAHGSQESESAATARLNPLALQVAAQYRQDALSPVVAAGFYRITEFFLVLVTGYAVFAFYIGFGTHLALIYLAIILGVALATVILFEFSGNYRLAVLRMPLPSLHRLLFAWISIFAGLAVLAFLLKSSSDFSRGGFTWWLAGGFFVIVAGRLAMARMIRVWAHKGILERRVVLVGGGEPAEQLIRSFEQQSSRDVHICGIFDDRDDQRSPPMIAGYPKLGTIDELIEFARIAHIDTLIVTLPLTAEQRVLTLLKKLWVLPVDIRISAHTSQLQFHRRAYSFIGSVPMLDIFDRPINDWDWVAKRIFDIVFSILGIIALSPVMVATAIAIKLDSRGPVIFRQKRHGFNNEIIEVYKFRSLHHDQGDPTARQTVTRDDPRVTRVGRFIRKYSLDELPQFFNVLQGSLSLVGPRPHAVSAQSHDLLYHEVVEGYFARHKVKPGITGWAQINGWRGEVDNDEKIRKRTEFDLFYIENWSLWFDLAILFLTPIRLFNTKNAY